MTVHKTLCNFFWTTLYIGLHVQSIFSIFGFGRGTGQCFPSKEFPVYTCSYTHKIWNEQMCCILVFIQKNKPVWVKIVQKNVMTKYASWFSCGRKVRPAKIWIDAFIFAARVVSFNVHFFVLELESRRETRNTAGRRTDGQTRRQTGCHASHRKVRIISRRNRLNSVEVG